MAMIDVLKKFRDDNGMTQKQVADLIGVTNQYVNDIEHGRRRLPDSRLAAMPFCKLRTALIRARQAEYRELVRVLGEALGEAA